MEAVIGGTAEIFLGGQQHGSGCNDTHNSGAQDAEDAVNDFVMAMRQQKSAH